MLTTVCAAAVGLGLFLWIAPGNLPLDVIGAGAAQVPEKLGNVTYYDHFLSVIPNNILQPYLQANVLSVMFISASVGLAFAFMPRTENREAVLKVLFGLQELLFTLIKVITLCITNWYPCFCRSIICSNRSGRNRWCFR